MLSCLSLLHLTHVRVERADDPHRTACGISVVGTVDPDMFAEPASTATCTGCRQAIGAALTPKSLVRRYLDETDRRVVVDDLIAEGPRVFARFHLGGARSTVQTAIFTVAGQRIVEIEPLSPHLEGTA